jgi:hypothetical protein
VIWGARHEPRYESRRVGSRSEPAERRAGDRRALRHAGRPAAVLVLVLAGFLTSASDVGARASAPAGDSIKLRARARLGVWRTGMSLKLVKTNLISFSVCGVWDAPASRRFACTVPKAVKLPAGTVMRLEQRPIKRALRQADTPGWGLLATSPDASLRAVLSNTVTGDRIGRFRYRVTLRDATGKILLRSNVLTVVWHR